MGKKKRQNQSSNEPVVGDSSESESGSSTGEGSTARSADPANKTPCQHIKKSVDLPSLRKNVKTNKEKNSHLTCSMNKNSSDPCKEEEAGRGGGGGWACLRCGSFNCTHHRLGHYLVPHSDSHALACHTSLNTVWCFQCEKEIPVDAQKLVQSSADFIKKQYNEALAPVTNPETGSDTRKLNGETSFLKDEEASSSKGVEKPTIYGSFPSLPKVRGLLNLGNTCFFNSVLQCLAQTPGLADLLDEMDQPGERFTLQLDEVTINAQLEKVKQSVLSEQLARVLREVAGAGGDAGGGRPAVNPRGLLSALTSRCRQFEGCDQHDAHELLRHLLDSVHSEDLKRYQKAILNHIGYKNNLDELDEEKKNFGKKLNQKVCETIPIRPDHIFKGSLVSILQCTVCGHESKREETFLDMSLPVLPEKAHHHIKKKVICNSPSEENQTSEVTLSKHQLKKEKKNARKNRKLNRNTNKINQENQGEPTIEEEDKKGESGDEDQSDADVEDNDEGVEGKAEAEVVESGYSSEKQASARGSPVLGTGAGARRLTVVIPTEADDTSQDSVHANASDGSPDTRERLQDDSQLPPEGERVDRTAMIIHWSCDGEANPGSAGRSASPDRPESGTEDFNAVEFESKNRSSPVEAGAGEVPASLDSGLLSLSLRGVGCAGPAPAPESPVRRPSAEAAAGDAPGEAAAARPAAIPLPPPPPPLPAPAPATAPSPPPARFRHRIEEGECSLQSCLHQFTSIEMLTGNNKVGCDACTKRANKGESGGSVVYQNSTKQLLICKLPPVMIFHLKRFEVQRFSFRKLSRPVEFPSVLDVTQFCADTALPVPEYSLYGVVEHSGNMHGGHYVAYVKVRSPPPGRWFFVSDSHVREADEQSALNAQAYLLFYERLEVPQH